MHDTLRKYIKNYWCRAYTILHQVVFDFMGMYDFPRFSRREKMGTLVRIIVGIVLTLVLYNHPDSVLVQRLFDETLDMYVQVETWIHKKSNGDDIAGNEPECVFFDYDDKSWENLGKPYWTPRGVVAGMIRHAANNGASVIIVDVLFEDRWPAWYKGNKENLCGSVGDDKLLEVLRDIGSTGVPILLARYEYSDGQLMPTFLANELSDDLPNEKYPNLYWATPVFPRNEDDEIVRDLPAPRKGENLPQIDALAAALKSTNSTNAKTIDLKLDEFDINKRSDNTVPRICFFYEEARACNLSENPAPYILHWRSINDKLKKTEKIEWDGDDDMGFMVWDTPPPAASNQPPYQGKIVIIGGSDHNVSDFHHTVIDDEMPGMYIHGNIIATFLRGNPPHMLGNLDIGGFKVSLPLLLDILLIVVCSFPLAQLEQKSVTVFVALPAVMLTVFFGIFYFTNVYIFIGIPVAILGFFELIADIKEILGYVLTYIRKCANG